MSESTTASTEGAAATTAVIEAPKGFVTFERSVQVRPFETAKASLMIQIPTKPGDTIEDVVAAAGDAFFGAKSVVLEQLGIKFDITPENRVMEVLDQQLGAVEVTPAQEAAAVAAQASTAARSNNYPEAPKDKPAQWAELCAFPKRWYDNRVDKKNANGPDFKRKGTGESLWLEYRGKNQVPDGLTVPSPDAF